jgi:hypothetical protein
MFWNGLRRRKNAIKTMLPHLADDFLSRITVVASTVIDDNQNAVDAWEVLYFTVWCLHMGIANSRISLTDEKKLNDCLVYSANKYTVAQLQRIEGISDSDRKKFYNITIIMFDKRIAEYDYNYNKNKEYSFEEHEDKLIAAFITNIVVNNQNYIDKLNLCRQSIIHYVYQNLQHAINSLT